MPLILEVEDIYFIIGLSRRGEVVNLRAKACGVGGSLTIEEYIVVYFLPDTVKIRSQGSINSIQSPDLKVIVLVLARIAGLESLHQYSRPIIFYAVECMGPTIYE